MHSGLKQLRVILSALTLDEFSVSDLVVTSRVRSPTVHTIVGRLRRRNWVECTGETRRTPAGGLAKVYRIRPDARLEAEREAEDISNLSDLEEGPASLEFAALLETLDELDARPTLPSDQRHRRLLEDLKRRLDTCDKIESARRQVSDQERRLVNAHLGLALGRLQAHMEEFDLADALKNIVQAGEEFYKCGRNNLGSLSDYRLVHTLLRNSNNDAAIEAAARWLAELDVSWFPATRHCVELARPVSGTGTRRSFVLNQLRLQMTRSETGIING